MELSKTFQQLKAYAIKKNLPLIPLRAKDVSIFNEPSSFYDLLINRMCDAKKRIALSALYIGSGIKEKALVQALCDNLSQNHNLTVHIALDAHRAKRFDSKDNSSLTVLREALAYDSVSLNLVQTSAPNGLVQRILSKFDRWNELSSTYHSKFMLFDNEVILTGANLSSIYFDRRQDRYMTIRNSDLFNDYLHGFIIELDKSTGSLKETIDKYNSNYTSRLETSKIDEGHDSFIVPLFQHGFSSIETCDDFLMFLQTILPSTAQLHMSTGYFNPFLDLKLTSVLAPTKQANGFFNGDGLLKYVPELYSVLLKKYNKSNPKCKVYQYDRQDWSYHAKGLWIDGIDDLTIHMIGSSNFNWRSSSRDFELQFLIISKSREMRDMLEKEREHLWEYSRLTRPCDLGNVNLFYRAAANMIKSLL